MRLYSLLSDLENTASQQPEGPNSRREAVRVLGSAGKRVALAALPLGLSGLFTPAQAKATAFTLTGALQFLLKMAQLQAGFYKQALQVLPGGAFPTAGVRTAVETILNHKIAHVNVLSDALTQLDETAGATPAFDFTVNGQFASVFADYATFLTVAQSLEDAGVRASKGMVTEFIDNKILLKIVLGIHGAQARHAGQVRNMRGLNGETGLAPWVSQNNANGALAQAYAGEEVTTQAGVPIAALPGVVAPLGIATATQAFDEPFTTTEAQAFLDLFLA